LDIHADLSYREDWGYDFSRAARIAWGEEGHRRINHMTKRQWGPVAMSVARMDGIAGRWASFDGKVQVIDDDDD
jgi:hypothetical protein